VSRDQLIRQADSDFDELLSSFEGLSEEQMLQAWFDGWSVRDILAHVSGWHREMTPVLERIAKGERPVPEGVSYDDADAWNAKFAAAHKDTTPAAMVEELKASEEAFLAAAKTVPEERFEEGRAAHRILNGTGAGHYREHIGPIREWRQAEGI
jgi:hypothetical protein